MDGATVELRLLAYLQGALLLGTVLFATPWSDRLRRAISGVAMFGAALTAVTVLVLASSLSESGGPFDWPTVGLLVFETPAGWAAIARILLFVAMAVAVSGSRHVTGVLGVAAVATLAWNGHGSMTDGVSGWVHLIADALHLIAGLGWIGAVTLFLRSASRTSERSPELVAGLERFASTGSIIVAVLLATGIANTLFIVGWDAMGGMGMTSYGRLLVLKILLFMSMLAAAALNRFWLTPRLASGSSLVAIRASLAVELLLGAGVVGVVSWLGTLDPAL